MKAVLQRLRAEIRSDRASFSARIDELKGLDLATASTPATAAQAAVALHHGYGAIESLLVRVSKYIEGALPAGSDWHIEPLESMALGLEGIRPRVLSSEQAQATRRGRVPRTAAAARPTAVLIQSRSGANLPPYRC